MLSEARLSEFRASVSETWNVSWEFPETQNEVTVNIGELPSMHGFGARNPVLIC